VNASAVNETESPAAGLSGAAVAGTVDPAEIGRFSALSEEWWKPGGPMAPLHAMNPVRLGFVRGTALAAFGPPESRGGHELRPLAGLDVLDVGCGAGLLSEPLARMGARVTGLDASADLIAVARAHAAELGLDGTQGLALDYRCGAVETLATEGAAAQGATGAGRYDLVTALEIVEHVADLPAFLGALATLVRPRGRVVLSTLNRSVRSFATAIVGAEYVLRLLPRGTHDWRRFLTPQELSRALVAAGFAVESVKGLVFRPLQGSWALGEDTGINYILSARLAG